MAAKGRLVVAITRTSMCSGRVSPNRSISRSCNTRSSFGCKTERHFANFIQQQRAGVGQFKFSRLGGHRPGKGAAHVPEQFAFQQRVGKPRAIDRHKGPLAAWAGAVHQARQQFLARAALGFHQDVRVGARHLPGAIKQPLRDRRAADKIAIARALDRCLHAKP